jgi:carbamoyl-phosphate synthase small subunit
LFQYRDDGYQEIFTDPSYFGQIMVATNPPYRNYGVNAEEVESEKIMISGLVCKISVLITHEPDSESNLYDYFENKI